MMYRGVLSLIFWVGFFCQQGFCQELQTTTERQEAAVSLGMDAEVKKAPKHQWLKATVVPLGLFAGGYGLYKWGTPNEGVKSMRDYYAPDFSRKYDDHIAGYTFLLPVGLELLGVKGQHKLFRTTVAVASSRLIADVGAYQLKKAFNTVRPSGGDHSFPSAHTTFAFVGAHAIHKEYGKKHPLYSVVAYSLAASCGVTRILNDAHWISDVVAGAGVGIASVELGYWLTGLVFKDKGINTPETGFNAYVPSADYDGYFSFKTGYMALLGDARDYYHNGMGFGMETGYYLNDTFGVGLDLAMGTFGIRNQQQWEASMPEGAHVKGMTTLHATLGPNFRLPVSEQLSVTARAGLGYARVNGGQVRIAGEEAGQYTVVAGHEDCSSLAYQAGAGLRYQLSKGWGVDLQAGYKGATQGGEAIASPEGMSQVTEGRVQQQVIEASLSVSRLF